MANEWNGGRESVGFGIESVTGTAVAPQAWPKHLSLGFKPTVAKQNNESAFGRVESVNSSAVFQQWAEGPIEGKVGDRTIGYPLFNMFGSVVTSDNADTNALVKDHTFDVLQSNTPPALTVAKKTPLRSRRYAGGQLESLNISFENGNWAMFNGLAKAGQGVEVANTIAYILENEFTRCVAKTATSVAGLAAALTLSIKQANIEITRPVTPQFADGNKSPDLFTTGRWRAAGQVMIRYNRTDLEDDWFNNTARAFQITFDNPDVTIGAAARPKLVFTAPQTTFATFDTSDDLEEVVDQTLGFSCEFSMTDGYKLRAVLTNTQAAYVAT